MTISVRRVDYEAMAEEIERLRADRDAVLAALDVARSLLISGVGQLNGADDHLTAGFAQPAVAVNGIQEIDLRTTDPGADQER